MGVEGIQISGNCRLEDWVRIGGCGILEDWEVVDEAVRQNGYGKINSLALG
jgi:hypothetical protein